MELKQALDETEKSVLALQRENVAQKQHADARQMELQEALDKSERGRSRSAKLPHRSEKLPMPSRQS